MKWKETITDFYAIHGQGYSNAKQFDVYNIEEFDCNASLLPNRRDFYKISIITIGGELLLFGIGTKIILASSYCKSFCKAVIGKSCQASKQQSFAKHSRTITLAFCYCSSLNRWKKSQIKSVALKAVEGVSARSRAFSPPGQA